MDGQALAMLADLASTEKGANLVSESGALPICVRLLQSSEVGWYCPPKMNKKGTFQKGRDRLPTIILLRGELLVFME